MGEEAEEEKAEEEANTAADTSAINTTRVAAAASLVLVGVVRLMAASRRRDAMRPRHSDRPDTKRSVIVSVCHSTEVSRHIQATTQRETALKGREKHRGKISELPAKLSLIQI